MKRTKWVWLAALITLSFWSAAASVLAPINLSGQWRFELDPDDVGIKQEWFNRSLSKTISLPGILQGQGYGEKITAKTPWVLSLYDHYWYERQEYRKYAVGPDVKVPFLSQPPLHYLGAAWYQRDIDIPPGWSGDRASLFLERPHWGTTVWLDSKLIGTNNSLVAPHEFEIGGITPGRHTLTIRIDNRMLLPYRPDSHSVSDSLGASWNGIAGAIELRPTSKVYLSDIQIFPSLADRSALVKVDIANASGTKGSGTLEAGDTRTDVQWDQKGGHYEIRIPLPANVRTWDEFHPVMQHLTVKLKGTDADDGRDVNYGVREFTRRGNEFLLNGRLVYFRGTHNGGDFPLTGFPPTDVESWRRIIRICQQWGLNLMRFHSWCPPEAAFIAADELGFYLQPEAGMWNAISPGTPMERMMYEETERMIHAYGNHPSYLMLSPSNEPSARWKESLPKWVEHFRKADPRRMYTTGTGWSLIDEPGPVTGADYLAVGRIGPNRIRGEGGWFGKDYSAAIKGVDVPILSHETGQWVAFPDFDIIRKFTGYLRPENYEIFRDSMAEHGLLQMDKAFALASGKYQVECYKAEIEANLRTPGLSGFELLDLHDYLGQGTALVGMLDTFWESKGYVTAAEFRRFNGPTVPLVRLEKRVFKTNEHLRTTVEISHFGEAPLRNVVITWRVTDATRTVILKGELKAGAVPIGKNFPLGEVDIDLSSLKSPKEYKLVVSVGYGLVQNDWNFWVYPAETAPSVPSGILVTRDWAKARAALIAGGRVLYVPRGSELAWTNPPLDTVPVFWNRLMGPAWGRMLGLYIEKNHPAMSAFPTSDAFDWQWTSMVGHTRALNLDRFNKNLKPIVWAIDDWNRNYKLGLLFEGKFGSGKLVVSSIDITQATEEDPALNQLRRSVLDYMAGNRFHPQAIINDQEMNSLFFDTLIMKQLKAQALGESAAPNSPSNAIDGDPNTYWMVGDNRKGAKYPHEITITFPEPVQMSGLVIMPRQNQREHEGDIREYSIEASEDGEAWREIVRGQLESTFEPQEIRFARQVAARNIRLIARSGFGNDGTTALAEIAVFYSGPKLSGADDGDVEYQRNKSASPDIDDGSGGKPAPARKPPVRKKP